MVDELGSTVTDMPSPAYSKTLHARSAARRYWAHRATATKQKSGYPPARTAHVLSS